jgi:2-phosphosulfolactate phosphatase
MNIDVAFTPSEVQALDAKVCVVVDVIRSTSSMAVIMSRNPGRVILTPTVQKAMKFASQQAVYPLLCGERAGMAPDGFDFGNSPREYADASLQGRTLVFTSSNGTRAIGDVGLAAHVLLGSFLNASAVTEQALDLACRDRLDILFVCAGREEKFALDDAYCAGFLVSQLLQKIPVEEEFTLGDGGQASLGIFGYYRDPLKVFQKSGSGQAILDIGLEDDIPFLLERDMVDAVPHLLNNRYLSGKREWGFTTFLTESY